MRKIRVRRLAAVAMLAAAGCGRGGEVPGASAGSEVAARVGDRTFTLADVDAKGQQMNMEAYQALYDARKTALEELVSEHLLATEAAARGITRDALIDQEVNAKIVHPTAEQISAFYKENQGAMRGRSLDDMSAAIRNHLAVQSRQQALGALLASLHTKHGVNVVLAPPRAPVTIAANDPTKGPASAPVKILEFSDFQ